MTILKVLLYLLFPIFALLLGIFAVYMEPVIKKEMTTEEALSNIRNDLKFIIDFVTPLIIFSVVISGLFLVLDLVLDILRN